MGARYRRNRKLKYGGRAGSDGYERVLEEFLWVRNAIYYSIGHYFGVRKLLPVFWKPEVLIGDLPNVYNIAYTFGKKCNFYYV